MTRRVWYPLVSLTFLLILARQAQSQSTTGPWDVQRLLAAPTPVEVIREQENLQSIWYPSEAYHQRPTQVFAYLATPSPKDFGNGPYPAMLLVHGGGGAAFAEWAQLWADRGYVALAMDLAGNGSDGKPHPAGGPPQDDASKFKSIETEKLDDTWPYQAVAAVLRGHALLKQLRQVDPNKIGITGISWGGYLTCIVAGIDHELAVAAPVYGCGFLGENSHWLEAGTFDQLSPDARRKWLQEFDPSRYVAGVSCPILFVNGTNDFAYPLDSYRKTYGLVQAPRTLCITVNMPHGHPQGWAPPEIGAFADNVLKGTKPLAKLSPLEVSGATATAKVDGDAKLTQAQLHYSTDTGRWQDRKWTSEAIKFDSGSGVLAATLPVTRSIVLFLTARDDRGLTVSTNHVELGP